MELCVCHLVYAKRKSHRQWGQNQMLFFDVLFTLENLIILWFPPYTKGAKKTIPRLDLKRLTYRNTANEESECTPCLDFLVTLELFFLTEIKPVKLEKITPIIGKKYLFSPHLIIFFRASLPLNFPGCKCDQNLKVQICLVKVRRNGETRILRGGKKLLKTPP